MPSVETLIELLRKISKTTDHVKIIVDYNGRSFKWKVPQYNLSANEWRPGETKDDEHIDLKGRNH